MESDFILITMNVFRNEALNESKLKNEIIHQKITECTLATSFEEILGTYETVKPIYEHFPHSLCYIWSLVILKLPDGFQSSEKGIEFFSWVKLFIEWKPKYSALVWSNYSHSIINELLTWPITVLCVWTQLLISYKHVSELAGVFQVLKISLIKEFWTAFKQVNQELSISSIEHLLKILRYLIDVDDKQLGSADLAIDTILKELTQLYDIDGFKSAVGSQAQTESSLGRQILLLIDSSSFVLNDSNSKLYKKIKEKLGIKHKHPFIPDPNILATIEFETFESSEKPFYSKKCSEFTVAAYRWTGITGNQERKPIVVKVYSYYSPEFFEKINEEIKILTFLSNRRHENPMFLEFYDHQLKDNECYLFMEDGGMSLMDFITEKRANKTFLDKQLVETWIQDLVQTFAWLSNICVYHRDIKPHNILVSGSEGNLKLKIIDFNVSLRTQEPEYTHDGAKSMPIQGTMGYMAPELEDAICKGEKAVDHKPGKADVFSLGITILQIITFENYNGLNREALNDKLMEKVENLDCLYWVKSLLKLMLEKDYKKRISFRKCVSKLPGSETIVNT